MKWISEEHSERLCKRYPEGKAWLKTLPKQIEELVKTWELEGLQKMPIGLAGSVVIACRQAGASSVLKLAVDAKKLEREWTALQHWGSRYTPEVYKTTTGAYLMERILPGSEWQGEPGEMIKLLDSFRSLPIPNEFPLDYPLAHEQLRSRIVRYQSTLAKQESPLLASDFILALKRLDSLTSPSLLYIVHADIHQYSLLNSERGVVVIDPMAARGHWAYDAACFAAKHKPALTESRIASLCRRWPEEATYIQMMSKVISVDEAAVNWIYQVHDTEDKYDHLLSWARS